MLPVKTILSFYFYQPEAENYSPLLMPSLFEKVIIALSFLSQNFSPECDHEDWAIKQFKRIQNLNKTQN